MNRTLVVAMTVLAVASLSPVSARLIIILPHVPVPPLPDLPDVPEPADCGWTVTPYIYRSGSATSGFMYVGVRACADQESVFTQGTWEADITYRRADGTHYTEHHASDQLEDMYNDAADVNNLNNRKMGDGCIAVPDVPCTSVIKIWNNAVETIVYIDLTVRNAWTSESHSDWYDCWC